MRQLQDALVSTVNSININSINATDLNYQINSYKNLLDMINSRNLGLRTNKEYAQKGFVCRNNLDVKQCLINCLDENIQKEIRDLRREIAFYESKIDQDKLDLYNIIYKHALFFKDLKNNLYQIYDVCLEQQDFKEGNKILRNISDIERLFGNFPFVQEDMESLFHVGNGIVFSGKIDSSRGSLSVDIEGNTKLITDKYLDAVTKLTDGIEKAVGQNIDLKS